MTSTKPILSVLMPTYNGASVLAETISCLLNQHVDVPWELVICDDGSTDETVQIAESFKDSRIRIFQNAENLGYPGNLNRCLAVSNGEFVFLFGQDDLLQSGALQESINTFQKHPEVGAVCRPYFAFDNDIEKPVRYKKRLEGQSSETRIVTMESDLADILGVFHTLDQLSGLAFRRKWMKLPFHEDVFPCHVYPFADILKDHAVAFLPTYTVAVRTWTSQCRSQSWIYDKSPVLSWAELFSTVFPEERNNNFRRFMLKQFVGANAIGLLQIRNYGTRPLLFFLREVVVMARLNPRNLIRPFFIAVAFYCLIIPPSVSKRVVDSFKRRISSLTVPQIDFIHS
jgi:glycosyltransferase involved in cell wall biosynthesis